MRCSLRLCLVAVLAAAAAGCALPGRMDGDPNAPKALSNDLMQTTPDFVYQRPPRDQVLGCAVVGYDIARDGTPQNVEVVQAEPPGYFEEEVLNLMKVVRFKPRKKIEHGTRTFTYIPKGSDASREAAASLCASSLSLPAP